MQGQNLQKEWNAITCAVTVTRHWSTAQRPKKPKFTLEYKTTRDKITPVEYALHIV